jgi:type IV pilus assembly protein PilW
MLTSRRSRSPRPNMGGMSLMEILVAMAIGLIGIVVITQTYIVNENYKRSTTAAGGAQTNGALALFSMERDARMAGWGMAWSTVFGCGGVRWYYNGLGYSNPPAAGPLPVLASGPIVITDGGAGPDTITITYGTNTERVIPATVGANMVAADDPIQVDNPQGFSNNPGDLVLVVQNTDCAMLQVTSLAGGQIAHAPGVTAPYNPAGGSLLPIFGAGAQVFNLGRPVVNVYSINANYELQLASLFTATSSTVVPAYTPTPFTIVDNIVDLQAEYGKDTVGNDGIVDVYDNVTPTTVAQWQQVLSVRIGVLARSEFYVKPANVGDPCSATTAVPTWQGGAFNVPGGIPSCYGYRVFETVVPLRNMIWRQG